LVHFCSGIVDGGVDARAGCGSRGEVHRNPTLPALLRLFFAQFAGPRLRCDVINPTKLSRNASFPLFELKIFYTLFSPSLCLGGNELVIAGAFICRLIN
jgi:hypothetical protein